MRKHTLSTAVSELDLIEKYRALRAHQVESYKSQTHKGHVF